MRSSLVCVALLGCLLGAALGAAPSRVFLVDSEAGAYLQSSSESVTVSAAGLCSLISALDGLLPPAEVDADVYSAINSVVKASPLRKPRAHVVLNVPGISQEELAQVFGSKQLREVQISGEQSSSQAVVEALSAIATANPELHLVLLDHQGLEGCTGNCIAEYMQATAEAMGARFEANRITFASGAVLDLSNLADKTFAVEAAAVYSGLQAHIKSSSGAQDDILVLEATMVSLHALRHAYGADSEQLLAAKAGMVRMLQLIVQGMGAKFEGDVVYTVSMSCPKHISAVKDIMSWKQTARRSLAEGMVTAGEPTAYASSSAYPPADQDKASRTFTTKACAYGGFILLLYFSLAAVWCMCNMPMKQDTMLFGAKKTE